MEDNKDSLNPGSLTSFSEAQGLDSGSSEAREAYTGALIANYESIGGRTVATDVEVLPIAE